MKDYLDEKLNNVIEIALVHQLRLEDAYAIIKSWKEIDKDMYYQLTKEQVAITDQFVYRFAKLQDLLGEKIFKPILEYVGEETEKYPFIDILNKLERLEVIESARTWLDLRTDRNKIAHDYAKNMEEILDDLKTLISKKDLLLSFLQSCLSFLETRGFKVKR